MVTACWNILGRAYAVMGDRAKAAVTKVIWDVLIFDLHQEPPLESRKSGERPTSEAIAIP
jgi:hypothetical protein